MNDQPGRTFTSIPVFSAILALIFAGGAYWQSQPLDSQRQVGSLIASSLRSPYESVQARLAEDPLEALSRHLLQEDSEAKGRRDSLLEISRSLHSSDGACSLRSSLSTLSACFERAGRLQGITTLKREIGNRLHRSPDSKQLAVLAVSLRGGTLSEAIELRRRLRTATVSALARRGAFADQEGNLSYLFLPFLADLKRPGISLIDAIDDEAGFVPVPYEFFSTVRDTTDMATTYQDVLVFWLDDRLFPGPGTVAGLAELIAAVAPPEETEKLDPLLLGPSSSAILAKILPELKTAQTCTAKDQKFHQEIALSCGKAETLVRRMRIYSPLATEPTTVAKARLESPSVEPVTSDDGKLMAALRDELSLRGINLSGKNGDRIALVTELDTPYGKAMIDNFKGTYNQKSAATVAVADPFVRFYLRGLDGELPGSNGSRTAATEGPRGPLPNGALEKAEGRELYDYLRRLGEDLWKEDQQLRRSGGRLRAIGIFGSDYYDKQLLLQALRPWFPDAVFFTTDFDARFLQPTQQTSNRNLVIASSFDLRLREDLQGPLPPFRDTYSTATFLGALLALGPCTPNTPSCRALETLRQSAENGELEPEPLLFEIGRTKAIRLRPALRLPDSNVHPPDELFAAPSNRLDSALAMEDRWGLWILRPYLGFVSVCIVLLATGDRLRKHYFKILGGILVCLSLYLSLSLIFPLEPTPLFEGVSVRGTELCRMLIFVLAGIFYWRGKVSLKTVIRELDPYFCESSPSESHNENADTVKGGQPPGDSESKPRKSLKDWIPQTIGWFRLKIETTSVHRSFPYTVPDQSDILASNVWKEFLRLQQGRGLNNPRHVRVGIYAFATLASGCLLVHLGLIQYPMVPIRGSWDLLADRLLRYLSLTALGLIAIWSFDVIRLTAALVNRLASGPTTWPDNAKIGALAKAKGTSPGVLSEYIDIVVIARLTEFLAPIILFPFALTALFIISRSSVFDAWHWPWLLAMLVGILLFVVFLAASLLWRAAERARLGAIEILENLRQKALASSPEKMEASEKQLEALIAEIRAMSRGAFAPWTSNPLVGSLLLPFGGAGATGLIDFLVHLGL